MEKNYGGKILIKKKDDVTRKLTPIQYQVTQENGTERLFINEFWNSYKENIF